MANKFLAGLPLAVYILAACLLCGQSFAATDTAAAEAGSGAQPKIIFSEQSHDFGDQPPNASPRHRFSFKNSGGETLIIEKIKAG